MKDSRDFLKSFPIYQGEPREIHYQIYRGKLRETLRVCLTNEIYCIDCKGTKGYICVAYPEVDKKLCWFCANEDCMNKSIEISKQNAREAYFKAQGLNEIKKSWQDSSQEF